MTPEDLSTRREEPFRSGKADLHVHTCHEKWGDGNDTVEAILAFVETQSDLDILALTDHDSTKAGRTARELHAQGTYRFEFLPGTEVTTTSGHLLCYFPREIADVPSLRSLSWTIRFVQDHDGICILAHPVYPPWLRRSVKNSQSRIIQSVEGVETLNAGLSSNAQSRLDDVGTVLAGRCALVGNSDAHHRAAIGSVVTMFPGRTIPDFIQALQTKETRPVRREHVKMPSKARSFTRRRSMTRPGWVRNVYREVANKTQRGRETE